MESFKDWVSKRMKKIEKEKKEFKKTNVIPSNIIDKKGTTKKEGSDCAPGILF